MEQTKTCSKCKEVKSLSEFYKDISKIDSYYSSCKVCVLARQSWKNVTPTQSRKWTLNRRYGITPEEYDLLFEAQNGVCYICQKPCVTGKRLAVDHDHDTGAIRGLLCTPCNKYVVGNLNVNQIYRILEYMDNPPANKVFGNVRRVPDDMVKPKRRVKRRKRTK